MSMSFVCCFLFFLYKQQEDIQAGSEEPLLQILEGECEEISSDQGEVAQPLPQVIHYDQCREPVLEYEMFSKLVIIDMHNGQNTFMRT